jgi:hypothetical protein
MLLSPEDGSVVSWHFLVLSVLRKRLNDANVDRIMETMWAKYLIFHLTNS